MPIDRNAYFICVKPRQDKCYGCRYRYPNIIKHLNLNFNNVNGKEYLNTKKEYEVRWCKAGVNKNLSCKCNLIFWNK